MTPARWSACAAAACALSAAGGWLAHAPPPAPAVALSEAADAQRASAQDTSTHEVTGRVTETTERFACPPPATRFVAGATRFVAGPERLVERIVRVTEPATMDTASHATEAEHVAEHVALTVTPPPAPLPRWSLFAAAQVLPEVQPVIGVGLRVVGPVWLEGQLRQPLSLSLPAATVGLRVTW